MRNEPDSETANNEWTSGSSRLIVCGAAPDTANLGVLALLYSTLRAVSERIPGAHFTVLDHGKSTRREKMDREEGGIEFARCGAYRTRRFWRPESWGRINFTACTGLFSSPTLAAFERAAAVLDASGGDSFTDLYGPGRFHAIIAPKMLALKLRKLLILLPQTYGPFNDSERRKIASRILRGCHMAWSRDERNFNLLRELLGRDFDPRRHRCGVDLAFGLETLNSELMGIGSETREMINPLVGINVSGLIYNRPEVAAKRYNFKAEYGVAIMQLIRLFLRHTDARLVLVPHVVTPAGHYESDIHACHRIRDEMAHESEGRLEIMRTLTDPRQVKWHVSQMDWFCGTRLHSTIAALSSGVPTAAIAYSSKTLGVFETCGQQSHVADPRCLDTDKLVDVLWSSWNNRVASRALLMQYLPAIRQTAVTQMDAIVGAFAGAEEDVFLSTPAGVSQRSRT